MEFDAALAERTVAAVVRKKAAAGMFDAYPDLQRGDLIQHCLTACVSAWPNYNPTYKASTFFSRISLNKLLDLSRVRARERVRIHGAAIEEKYEVEIDDVAGWCEEKMQQAGATFSRYGLPPRFPKSKRSSIDRVQASVLVALQIRLKLSCRALAGYLSSNPAVLAVMGLNRPPSYRAIHRARAAVTIIKKKLTVRTRRLSLAAA